MYEQFIVRDFRTATQRVIQQANDIIAEYQEQGYTLTLRQLYYQFVARDLLENTQQSYDRLGSIVNDARLAGFIDWEAIEDRTRNLETNAHWENPQEILESARDSYFIDMWVGQPTRVEVWIEKQALVGVIERVCEANDVPYFACRGYVSQSEQWRAYRRFLARWNVFNQDTLILHLGDHDPSGIDMTRDNRDRQDLFLTGGLSDEHQDVVTVKRIALNKDQVRKYRPPPNPAKSTDSRHKEYVRKHGTSSWELDALEPKVLTELIQAEIDDVIDLDEWKKRERKLERDRKKLTKLVKAAADE